MRSTPSSIATPCEASEAPAGVTTALCRWLGLALLVAGVVAFWALRIEATARAVVFEALDLFATFLPAYVYEQSRLRSWEVALWNPYQGGGQPFFAQLQYAALYPARLLLLPMDPPAAMRVSLLAHVLIAVTATYGLGLALGFSCVGAALAAVVFGAGFALPNLYWPSFLEPGAWIPVAAWAALALARTGAKHWVVALGISAAMPVLAGGYQVSLYAAYAVSITILAVLVDPSRRGALASRSGIAALAAAAALAFCTAAPQLLPTLAWSHESVRTTLALAPERVDPDADPFQVLVSYFVAPSIERAIPLSAPVAALALLGWASGGPFARVIGIAAIVAFGLALGRGTPWFDLYFALPGLSMFRLPERLGILVAFWAALGAGFGLRTIERARVLGRAAPWVSAGAALAAAAVMLAPLENRAWLPWRAPETLVARDSSAAAEVRAAMGPGRALAVNGFGRAFPVRIGMLAGAPFLQDYEPLSSHRLRRFFEAVFPAILRQTGRHAGFFGIAPDNVRLARPDLLDIAAVDRVWLVEGARVAGRGPAMESLGNVAGLELHRRPGAPPRAFLTGRVRLAPDEARALAILRDDTSFDPRREVVLVGEAGPGDSEIASVLERCGSRACAPLDSRVSSFASIRVDDPERVVIDVEATEPSVLVLADAFAPGWSAMVDGVPRRLWQANYLVRGVGVGPGDRTVEMRYDPPGLRLGLTLATLAWTIAALVLAMGRFQSRARGAAVGGRALEPARTPGSGPGPELEQDSVR